MLLVPSKNGLQACIVKPYMLVLVQLTVIQYAVLELELTRNTDVAVKGLWVSPSGQHSIIALQAGPAPETHYLHTSWKKSRVISKLKGITVSCVGWNRLQKSNSSTG